ncbi:MAG: diadenylate cyclase [Phycisphaerales bacterium]|nr:diadenylate cyclase [Phycisphaerales bacterium]
MLESLSQFLRHPQQVLIELAVIWVGVYFVFRFLLGTRGAGIMRGLLVVSILVGATFGVAAYQLKGFERLRLIFEKLGFVVPFLLIVVFQPELRQAMVRVSELVVRRSPRRVRLADEVATAAEYLSRNQFGALIVIERMVRLGGLVEAGTAIDSLVSAPLLESIFYPNSPLHDLAVVVRGDRIVAAKVQLPLADTSAVPHELGSRHRAAMGITMECDCLVVVVSEETGGIRLAERGHLTPPIPREEFRNRLAERLNASPDESVPAEPGDINLNEEESAAPTGASEAPSSPLPEAARRA